MCLILKQEVVLQLNADKEHVSNVSFYFRKHIQEAPLNMGRMKEEKHEHWSHQDWVDFLVLHVNINESLISIRNFCTRTKL